MHKRVKKHHGHGALCHGGCGHEAFDSANRSVPPTVIHQQLLSVSAGVGFKLKPAKPKVVFKGFTFGFGFNRGLETGKTEK